MKGGWGSVTKVEPDLVPNNVVDVAVVLIIELLVDCLGLLQPSACISEEFVMLSHAFGHRSHPRLAWFIRVNGGGSRP
jgi:hypothetical protein